MANTGKVLSLTLVFVFVIQVLWTPVSGALLPFTQRDLDQIYISQTFRDPQASLLCSVTGATSGNKTVYFLGDSWLERIANSPRNVEDSLEDAYQIDVVGLNASVGRSISGGGEKDQTALEAVQADQSTLANVGAIVIILGTNSDNYDEEIPRLVEAIKDVTSAQLYWVNTSANADDQIASSAENANAAIRKYSEEFEYEIINFYNKAFPFDSDPSTIEVGINSPLMADDGIHPKIGEGTDVLIDMIGTGLGGANFGGTMAGSLQGAASRNSLPQVAKERLAAVEQNVEQNRAVYETLGAKYQMPWQVFGALHYREAGSDPGRSMLGGERLGEQAVDSDNAPGTLEESGDAAWGLFTELAAAVYDVEVSANMDFESLRLAFLAYHRGFLYARVPESEGGPWGPDIAPYVMNLYDESHIGDEGTGMLRPRGTSGTIGVSGSWGETVSGIDYPAGAMTYLAYFGYSPAGSYYGGDCEEQALAAGQFVWPVVDASGDPAGRVTACWADLRNKTISGGSYYHSGVDIGASAGTTVVAAQAGTVVFSGEHRTYGNLIIIDHGNGIWTHYGHLRSIEPSARLSANVTPNQIIGEVGNTGISLGDHLHLNMYSSWPFGSLPNGAANADGTQTINPLTNGFSIPSTIEDTVNCASYPDGGREVDIEL